MATRAPGHVPTHQRSDQTKDLVRQECLSRRKSTRELGIELVLTLPRSKFNTKPVRLIEALCTVL